MILGAGLITEKAFSIPYNYPGRVGPPEIKAAIGRLISNFRNIFLFETSAKL